MRVGWVGSLKQFCALSPELDTLTNYLRNEGMDCIGSPLYGWHGARHTHPWISFNIHNYGRPGLITCILEMRKLGDEMSNLEMRKLGRCVACPVASWMDNKRQG